MLSTRFILSTSVLLTLFSPLFAQTPDQNQEATEDFAAFRQLLDQVDPPSLHKALHNYSPKKFEHGMFQEDRSAVEVIHKTEPNLATSIINLAKRTNNGIAEELGKRQAGAISNSTTPTTTPNGNPEPATTKVAPVAPVAGGPSTSSPIASPGQESSTPAAPVVVPTTSTNANGVPVVVSITSTPHASPLPTFLAVGGSSVPLTNGEVITTTNAVGLLIISTVGGGVRTITPTKTGTSATTSNSAAAGQTYVQYMTSTLPNGSQSVVTSVTVVAGTSPTVETPSGTAGVGTTSAGASPGLQTAAAVATRGWGREMLCVVGGAVAVAGML